MGFVCYIDELWPQHAGKPKTVVKSRHNIKYITTMKKIALTGIVLLLLASMAGCKKPKDCHCTVTQKMPGMAPMVTEQVMTAPDGKCDKLSVTSTTTAPDGSNIEQTIECK